MKKGVIEITSLHNEITTAKFGILDFFIRRGSSSSKEPKSTPEEEGEHDFKSIKGRWDDPFLSILLSESPARVNWTLIKAEWKLLCSNEYTMLLSILPKTHRNVQWIMSFQWTELRCWIDFKGRWKKNKRKERNIKIIDYST